MSLLGAVQAFRQREAACPELMDDPNCDADALRRTYRQFGAVNGMVSGWRGLYRREVRPLLQPDRPNTLLDIGCGGGDLARHLARWAAHDGLSLRITGIDADARAVSYARAQPPCSGVHFRQALSSELVAEGQRFDVVISNHLLHHLTPAELAGLLRDSERLAAGAALHSDIGRSALAYLAFNLAVAPWFTGSFIRSDGLLSIRRSFTVPELRVLVPAGWDVRGGVPWRVVLTYRAGPE